jgi:hypothetical protein
VGLRISDKHQDLKYIRDNIIAKAGEPKRCDQFLREIMGIAESFAKSDDKALLSYLYSRRHDLQQKFPEVADGDTTHLIQWAEDCILGRFEEAQRHLLYRYAPLFASKTVDNQITLLQSELKMSQTILGRLQDELQASKLDLKTRDEHISRLQSELQASKLDLKTRDEHISRLQSEGLHLQSELHSLKTSFGYRLMTVYGPVVDILLPDGTIRGKIKKWASSIVRPKTP